jgi:hypothetical protein
MRLTRTGAFLFGLLHGVLLRVAGAILLSISKATSNTVLLSPSVADVRCVSRLFLICRLSRRIYTMTNDIQKFLDEVKGLNGEEAKQAEIAFMKQVIEKELRKAFATQKKKNDSKLKKAKI